MRLVLDLDSNTPIEFTRPTDGGPYPWLVSAPALRLSARAGDGSNIIDENESLEVELDNAGKQLSRIIEEPMRKMCVLYDDNGDEQFRGIVSRVETGRTMALTIQSGGGGLLLSEPLPLRTTRQIGDFARDAFIPEWFGDLTSARQPLIRLSSTEYLSAGHAHEIAKVFIDDELTLAWEATLGRDAKGNVW